MSKARELAELGAVYDSGALSNRNLIINGAMEVAQRGTSVTGSTAGGSVLTVDRFFNHASGATYDSTQESVTLGGETGLPVQFKKYHKFNVTTGANNCAVWQTVEDVTKVQGTHTLSFYAKGVNPAGGNVDVSTRQDFGSGGSTEVDVLLGNIVLTSSWQRFKFTFDVASVAGKTIGASSYFRPMFHQPDDDSGTAAWNLQITGVQLEAGSEATPFEHRSFGDELARCQRYFVKYTSASVNTSIANGLSQTSSTGTFTLRFNPELRSSPSIAISGLGMTDHTNYTSVVTSNHYSTTSNNSLRFGLTGNAVMTTYRPASVIVQTANGYLSFDAEL